MVSTGSMVVSQLLLLFSFVVARKRNDEFCLRRFAVIQFTRSMLYFRSAFRVVDHTKNYYEMIVSIL